MLFSHISDTHLGLVQYGSEEREDDFYKAFDQAIDISIKDRVDFVIFAGDIFHVPNPSGRAILHMANGLKRLKQSNIDSFFILGEHDISRVRATPVPYVYHNLEFSSYIGQGRPRLYKNILLVGFDKIRKSEVSTYEQRFREIDSVAREHRAGHKILVMHQAITEANRFAGELNSADLPNNFTYYAMGHLHDQFLKNFSHLGGPLAYPGSTELTASEGIKQTQKGFYEVDISSSEAMPSWIELDIRPQHTAKTTFENLTETVDGIAEKISGSSRKPIVELQIQGKNIEPDLVQAQISRLSPHTLHCCWRTIDQKTDDTTAVASSASTLLEKPARIDYELFKLAVNFLGSEQQANFAVKELMPLLSTNQLEQVDQVVVENFERFKRKEKN